MVNDANTDAATINRMSSASARPGHTLQGRLMSEVKTLPVSLDVPPSVTKGKVPRVWIKICAGYVEIALRNDFIWTRVQRRVVENSPVRDVTATL